MPELKDHAMRPTLSRPPDVQYPELSHHGCELLSRLHWAQNLLAMATRHIAAIVEEVPVVEGDILVAALKALFIEDPTHWPAAHGFEAIEEQVLSEGWTFTPEEGL